MRVYKRNDFTWKDNKLYLKDRLFFTLVPKLFKIRWPDGVESEDIYNKTRAVEHAFLLALKEMNEGSDLEHARNAPAEPAGALK